MRVLIYAINGVGLGHINRQVCIALRIREKHPDAKILFVTNSDFTGFFYRHKFKFVKLPKDFDNPLFTAEDFEFAVPKPANLKILEGVLDGFRPDAALFDTHFPEEFVLECRRRGVKNYLVLREFDPVHVERFVHQRIRGAFERVFIASTAPEGINAPEGMEFVGPVVRDELFDASVKQKYRIKPGELSILVSSGGGGYERETEHFLSATIRACLGIAKKRRVNIIAVCGPLFRGHQRLQKGIKLVRFEEQMTSLMRSVDFMISQAGYNACNEIVSFKVPALILPVYRETEDQKGRAYQLAEKGLCLTLPEWDSERIEIVLERIAKNPNVVRELKSCLAKSSISDGAESVAAGIFSAPTPQPILLANQLLSEVLNSLNPVPSKLVLEKGEFSWVDLKIVLEFLKEGGSTEIHLILDMPVPPPIHKELTQFPAVYMFKAGADYSKLDSTIRALKALQLPVCAILNTRDFEDIKHLEKGVEWLISHRVYSIQLLADTDSTEYSAIVNKRMAPENFLLDISLRREVHYPGKGYMIEKEITELVNRVKRTQNELLALLESKGLSKQVELLKQGIEAIPSAVVSGEIELKEAERYALLKPINDELDAIDKEIAIAREKLEVVFNHKVKGVYAKRGGLYHECYLLLSSAGLLETLRQSKEEAKRLEAKKNKGWKEYNEMQHVLEALTSEYHSAIEASSFSKRVKGVEAELKRKQEARDRAWNGFLQVEKQMEEMKKNQEKELSLLPGHSELQHLRQGLSVIEGDFSKLMKEEFEPMRRQISILSSMHSLTEEEREELERLGKKRDEVWGAKLAPLETQRDLLSVEIRKLEAGPEFVGVIGRHRKEYAALEKMMENLGSELEMAKNDVKALEEKLARAKSSKGYAKLIAGFEKRISEIKSRQQQFSKLVEECDKRLEDMKSEQAKAIEKKGIKPRYDEIEKEIARLTHAIELKSKPLKPAQDYLEFLSQKREHLLISSRVSRRLSQIEGELAKDYKQQDKASNGARIREIQNKLNLLLIKRNVFKEYYAFSRRISELESRMGLLRAY